MLITHDIRPQGHYVTTHQDNITLTIRTEHGTASEMAAEAADMRKKANRLTRNANLIRDAIYSDQWEHRTPAGRHTATTAQAHATRRTLEEPTQ